MSSSAAVVFLAALALLCLALLALCVKAVADLLDNTWGDEDEDLDCH